MDKKRNTREEVGQLKQLNIIGGRIEWVRKRLGIDLAKAARELGIPRTSYMARELDVRPTYLEEYMVIADYYDRHWQEKYKDSYPHFADTPLTKITPGWILFGNDRRYDALMDEIERLTEEKMSYEREIAILKQTIDMCQSNVRKMNKEKK